MSADAPQLRTGDDPTSLLAFIGEGLGVVDSQGEILWMTDRLAAHDPETMRLFASTCQEAARAVAEGSTGRRRRFSSGAGHFEVEAVRLPGNRALGILFDRSSRQRVASLIDSVDAAGGELLDLDAKVVNPLNVAERLRMLERKVVDTMSRVFHEEAFEIRMRDRKSDQLELVMSRHIEPMRIGEALFARAEGNGISGLVAATGESYICRDPKHDARYQQGLAGSQSAITVPLLLQDRVVGILNVESAEANRFGEEHRVALETYGRYIAMALNILDMLIVERCSTTERISEMVRDEIATPVQRVRSAAMEVAAGRLAGHEHLEQALEMLQARVTTATSGPRTVLGVDRTPGERGTDPAIEGKRILVADDDASVRETIQALLQDAGAQAESCADGAAALDRIGRMAAEGHPYHLVISDIRLPGRNGYEVFRGTKATSPGTALILTTGFGYDPDHSIVRTSQEGLSSFLFKPFRASHLMDEVRKALGGGSPEGARPPAGA